MKVTVVGAGAVGATCADNIARAQLADELVSVRYQRRPGRR
jgi:malate dehydrogenase